MTPVIPSIITIEFISAPKGQGFKAISTALKAIFSLRKTNPSSTATSRVITSHSNKIVTPQNSDHRPLQAEKKVSFSEANEEKLYANDTTPGIRSVLLELAERNADVFISGDVEAIQKKAFIPLDEIKRFVAYRDQYGAGKDIDAILKEYIDIRDLLTLAQTEEHSSPIQNILHKYNLTIKHATQIQKALTRQRIDANHFIAYCEKYGAGRDIDSILNEYDAITKLHTKLCDNNTYSHINIPWLEVFDLESIIPEDFQGKYDRAVRDALRKETERKGVKEIINLLSQILNSEDVSS